MSDLASQLPMPGATIGQPIPETDPTFLAFAAGQGYREEEARAYTALRQNAIHQAFQDEMPGLILAGQQKALGTAKTFGDAGAWRTGARVQQQGRDLSDFMSSVQKANDTQQQNQLDLQDSLAERIANLRMDTTQAALEARQNDALNQAAMGNQAFVNNVQASPPNIMPAPLAPPTNPVTPTAPQPSTAANPQVPVSPPAQLPSYPTTANPSNSGVTSPQG